VALKNIFVNSLLVLAALILSLSGAEFFINKVRPDLLTERRKFLQETEKIREQPIPIGPFNTRLIAFPNIGVVNARDANNYGMRDSHTYPYVSPSPKSVVVGLFGGSVADLVFPQLFKKFNADPIVKKLMNRGIDVQILNFAVGTGKQPQQLLTAIHFLENVDVFVNLDGTNEVTRDPGLNFPADFPVLTADTYFYNEAKYSHLEKFN
jgi:hypothetical protein